MSFVPAGRREDVDNDDLWSVFCFFIFPLIVTLIVIVGAIAYNWDGPNGIAMYFTKIVRERQRVRKLQESGVDVL